jgi:hypothetical protein
VQECDEDDMEAFYTVAPESEESDDDLDDFLSDKPKEAKEDREARIAKELEARKKAQAAADKAKKQQQKEHEEWLASMDEETRARWVAEQERKQRAAEEAMREEEMERERRRLEDAKRRAGAGGVDGGAATDAGKAAAKNDKIELKWAWSGEGGGRLVSEPVERKGPKKPVREIQLRFPKKKVGIIIGKAGVNIKIIEGKSRAKIQIHKPKVTDEEDDETLVTIKGSTEQIDRACETINTVFQQFSAAMKARRAAVGK